MSEQNERGFAGKVVLITGGAAGLGKALALELLEQGAIVAIADLNPANLTASNGTKAAFFKLDVADYEAFAGVVGQIVKGNSRLDYLFNNAGYAVSGEIRDSTPEQWEKIIAVNLKGVINGTLAVLPLMEKQGSGHIINTASLAGLVPSAGLSIYSTTKYAVVGFSNNLRLEASGLGIRVSVVCPGFIKTNIFEAATYNRTTPAGLKSVIPVKFMEVDQTARKILVGVLKNKGTIILPGYARLLNFFQKFCPPVTGLVFRSSLKKLRKAR